MTAYIVYAMPGTVIDISDNIVRKDISFMEPQRKFIEIDVRPFNAIFAGITANPSTNGSFSNVLPHFSFNVV